MSSRNCFSCDRSAAESELLDELEELPIDEPELPLLLVPEDPVLPDVVELPDVPVSLDEPLDEPADGGCVQDDDLGMFRLSSACSMFV